MPNRRQHYDRHSVFAGQSAPIAVSHSLLQAPHVQHSHAFSELVLVVAGQGEHVLPDAQYPIARGDVFVIPESGQHGYESTKGLELINVVFEAARLEGPLRELHELPGFHALFTFEPARREHHAFAGRLCLTATQLRHALRWVTELEKELAQGEPGYQLAATALFMRLVAYLSRTFASSKAPQAQECLRLGAALSHIETHLADPIRVEELAALTHLSPRQFHRIFRSVTGESPLQYQLTLRIERAKEMLQGSDETLTEIAFQCGFGDSNYFCRQFRKQTGMSPGAYRGDR